LLCPSSMAASPTPPPPPSCPTPSSGEAKGITLCIRARNLLLEISTSWWKGLGKFRPAAHQGLGGGGGRGILAGDLVETPPVSGPKLRSAGRRPLQNLRKQGLKVASPVVYHFQW
jgi:hypothetical protein